MDVMWFVEPMETWNAVTVMKWYFIVMITTFVLILGHKKLGIDFSIDENLDKIPGGILIILAGFTVPILEELVFRGIPYFLDMGSMIIVAGTALWALAHLKRVLIIVPMGILLMKLWMGGFWLEATAIHILHNCLFLGIYIAKRDMDNGAFDNFIKDFKNVKDAKISIKGENAKIVIRV